MPRTHIRKRLPGFYQGRDLTVILDADGRPFTEGKFLFGRRRGDAEQFTLVFDDGCEYHRDIAEKYGVAPLGGGALAINHKDREIYAGGRSQAYGREPDRQLTARAFEQALEGYKCTSD